MKKQNKASAFQYWNRLPLSENPKVIPLPSPGLRGTSYPGRTATSVANPNEVVSATQRRFDRNPVGVENICLRSTQGRPSRATLGWMTQSRWDCRNMRSHFATNL